MEINQPLHNHWISNVLKNMLSSGEVGKEKAEFILNHGTRFITKTKGANNAHWGSRFGWHGLVMDNTIHYPSSWERKPANDSWVLSSFVHEVVHLEQGIGTALSVFGELQAWQIGFRYYLSLTRAKLSREVLELIDLPLSHDREVLLKAKKLIADDQNNGMTGLQAVAALIRRRNKFSDIYWIYPLPLKPWKK